MRNPRWFPVYVFLLLIGLGFLSRLGPFGEALFNLEFDYATVLSPLTKQPDPEFTEKASLIYLDEASHQELNQPDKASWDRSLHAKLLDRLTEAEAGLVYFDILFAQESGDEAADQALEDAIRRNGKVILIAQLTNSWSGGVFSEQAILPLRRFREAAAGWGLAALREGSDGAIRRMPFDLSETTLSGPKVAARFLTGRIEVNDIKTQSSDYLRFYSDDPAKLENVWSYKQLLDDSVPNQRLKGKWFFIGVDQTIGFTGAKKDTFKSAYSRLSGSRWNGVDFHVTALENFLSGQYIKRVSFLTEIFWLIAGGLCLTASLLLPFVRQRIIYMVFLAVVVPSVAVLWSSVASTTTPFLSILLIQVPLMALILLRDQPIVYDVFISYSFSDALAYKFLKPLTAAFNDEGIRWWLDEDKLRGGSSFAEPILKAIQESQAIVVIISKSALYSKEMEFEVRQAIFNKKKVIPVYLDRFEIEKLENDPVVKKGLIQYISKVLVARYLFSDKLVPEEFARLANRIAFDLKLIRVRSILTKLINKIKPAASLPEPKDTAEFNPELHEAK